MKIVLSSIVVLTISLTACGPGDSESQLQIIGGTPLRVAAPAARSIVALMDSTGAVKCSGVAIARNWILTAAHCTFLGLPKNDVFRAGLNVRDRNARRTVLVEKVVAHPDFSPTLLNQIEATDAPADLALIKIKKDIPGIVVAGLAAANDKIDARSPLRVAGYGRSVGEEQKSAGTALYWDFRVQKTNKPASELILSDDQGRTTCHGDSGGPVFREAGAKMKVFGIVSRGMSDCSDNRSVVTDLRSYVDWIKQTMDDQS